MNRLIPLLLLGGISIYDEGTRLNPYIVEADGINCVGPGVTCTYNANKTITLYVDAGGSGGSGGSGAPTNAQYWTGAADSTLSDEKNLGGLSTGLVINTGGTPSIKSANSCTNQFPRSDNASGAWTCASITDSDVPNNITIDSATTATTAGALTNNPADCTGNNFATSISANGDLTCTQPAFSNLSGSATIAQGGTTETASTEDAVLVGSSTTDWQAKVLPSCSDATTSKLLYNSSTNAFSCGTDQTAAGGPTKLGADVNVAVSASYVTVFTVTGATIGNSKNIELIFRVVHIATADTIGMQYRVLSADTGYVGNCYFRQCGISGSTVSASVCENDIFAIGTNPSDTGAGASCRTSAPCEAEIKCTLTSDASAGDVVLEAQLETGTTSAPIKAGSTYYTVTTN